MLLSFQNLFFTYDDMCREITLYDINIKQEKKSIANCKLQIRIV